MQMNLCDRSLLENETPRKGYERFKNLISKLDQINITHNVINTENYNFWSSVEYLVEFNVTVHYHSRLDHCGPNDEHNLVIDGYGEERILKLLKIVLEPLGYKEA